jgi:hypothetical protein
MCQPLGQQKSPLVQHVASATGQHACVPLLSLQSVAVADWQTSCPNTMLAKLNDTNKHNDKCLIFSVLFGI